ncbi:Aspartate/glutamate/uridylate kinase [Crepidotus variabilis]|uniref:Aspartate/glutamate/uridylate kinase n=1 Tax=Crepidotus variabilis TaxID=179855 RepID=A0A9P6EQS4_9AGAR|nr:Aspartate/glutamate/uridylate kinase [Crepidotus variabilis]
MGKDKGGLTSLPQKTIVIKLGTSSIVHETTHQPLLSLLSAVVETVVDLKQQGHKVVLVSSGAIGVGLRTMNMESRPKSLAGKQALAAIGQGRLIALWDNLFGQLDQPIAQVLLTRGDISDRTRYLNAVNTLRELLSMGVIPIVNENDTISVSEIKFGDNDTLSAITSSMIHADYLFLLTDVDGLYNTNPRKDPLAKLIPVVQSIAAIRAEVSTSTLSSNLGTGGMETKLIAAEIATAAGVRTVVMSGRRVGRVRGVVEYDHFSSSGETLTRERPPHTAFIASTEPLHDLKSWTSHTLNPSGSVIIDAGAHHVLSKRESGGRLLAAGVIGVIGAFASQQAVRIVIRRRRIGQEEREEERKNYLSALETTRPSTPTTAASLAQAPDYEDPSVEIGLGGVNGNSDEDIVLVETDKVKQDADLGEAEVVEVGRGLANYNSAQIMAVKGLNSSFLPQLLGYADSEYVVENVTIRTPFIITPSVV